MSATNDNETNETNEINEINDTIADVKRTTFSLKVHSAEQRNGAPRRAFALQMDDEEEATTGYIRMMRAPRKQASLQLRQSAALRAAVRAARRRLHGSGERFKPRFTIELVHDQMKDAEDLVFRPPVHGVVVHHISN